MTRRRVWVMLALTGALAACSGKQGSSTRIVVMVWSDLTVPTEMDDVRIDVTGPTGTRSADFALGEAQWPVMLDLVPPNDDASRFHVKATARLGSRELTWQEASLAFLPGQSRALRLFLGRACLGVSCPDAVTCSAGACAQAVDVSASDLPVYVPGATYSPPDGRAGTVDGGAAIGALDGGGVKDTQALDSLKLDGSGPGDAWADRTVATADTPSAPTADAAGVDDAGRADVPAPPDGWFVAEVGGNGGGGGLGLGGGGAGGFGGSGGATGTAPRDGTVDAATPDAPGSGGAASTGGTPGTGGAPGTGGTPGTGGIVATGGVLGSGGAGTGGASGGCSGVDLSSPTSCGTTCANAVACSTSNGTATCTQGACGILCANGFGNCDNDASTGCEANLNSPTACGTTCANRVACSTANGTASCTSGVCGISCSAGFGNCDNDASTGCEASLSSPESCGTTCADRAPCRYRVCQAGSDGAHTCASTKWGYSQATAATTTKLAANTLWAIKINIASPASTSLEALGISVVVDAANPSVNLQLGLYADSSGAPNGRVAQTASFATVDGLNDVLLPAAVSVTPAFYWAALLADGPVRVQVEAGTTTWVSAAQASGTLPTQFPLPAAQTIGVGHLYAVTAP